MIIYWRDSGFSINTTNWESIDDMIKEFLKMETIVESHGEKIWENEDWILLACTIHKNSHQIKGGHFIYKKNIIKIKVGDTKNV